MSLPSISEPANDLFEHLFIEIQGQSHLISLSKLHHSYSISQLRSNHPKNHAKEPKYTPHQIFRNPRAETTTSMAAQDGSEVDVAPPIPLRNPARLSRGSAAEIPPPIPPRNPARLSRVQPIPTVVIPSEVPTDSQFAPATFVTAPAPWFIPAPAPHKPQSRRLKRLVDKAVGRISDMKDWFRRHRKWGQASWKSWKS